MNDPNTLEQERELKEAAARGAAMAGTLASSRRELAPEIRAPHPADLEPVPERRWNQGEMDDHFARLFDQARALQANPGIGQLEQEHARDFVRQAKKRLGEYVAYREARGEDLYLHLGTARRRMEAKDWQENLPVLAQLFAGTDAMAEALPPEKRQAFLDSFRDSLDPQAEMIMAANLRLAAHLTNRDIDEVADSWPAFRAHLAEQYLGLPPESTDDRTFYQAAGAKLRQDKDDAELMDKIGTRAATLAMQGKPLLETMNEVGTMAGDRWKEFAEAARQGHASVLREFKDEELALADTLWRRFQRDRMVAAAATPSPEAPSLLAGLAEYGRMKQQDRERLIGLIALRAEDEGEDVENFFARLGQAFKVGMERGATGIAAGMRSRDEVLANRILEYGRVATKSTVPAAGKISYNLLLTEMQGEGSHKEGFKRPDTRPLTAEERAAIEQQRDADRGQRAFLTDLPEMGVRARRYMDDLREGFVDTWLDAIMIGTESLPMMINAVAPYGAGLILNTATYTESNMARLRRENPDSDAPVLQRTAYTSALMMAAIDRVQISIMGARMPRTMAWAHRQRPLLKYPLAAGIRVGTIGAAEFGQEILQDLTLPAMADLASALSEDIAGPDWEEVMSDLEASLGDLARVSLLFGIVGGAGHMVADRMAPGELRKLLTDREGLALAGYSQATIDKVATEAEHNPAAAAEELKAATMETPAAVRRENSLAALAQIKKRPPPPTAREAQLPEIAEQEDGRWQVEYPDGTAQTVDTLEAAVELNREWERDYRTTQEQGIREYLELLESYHAGNPELEVETTYTGRELTQAEWAANSAERLESARARVEILLRQAGLEVTPEDLANLDNYLILGSSSNSYADGVTRIAIAVNKAQESTTRSGATVLTPIEEHAEGIAKWLITTGKQTEAWFIQQIRAAEEATGRQTLPDDLMGMDAPARMQQIAEAFSHLAVGNAVGKMADSKLPAGLKVVFAAIREMITDILKLAADIAKFRASGKMDAEFGYWLDVAAGMNDTYRLDNLRRAEEAKIRNEARAEASSTIDADLRSKYTEEISNALKPIGVNVTSNNVTAGGSINTVLTFSQDGKEVGSAIRSIKNGKLRLATIGLDGGTGILRPLYAAESAFAQRHGLQVRARLSNRVNREKFKEYYPGYVELKGGRTLLWTPQPSPTFSIAPVTPGLGRHVLAVDRTTRAVSQTVSMNDAEVAALNKAAGKLATKVKNQLKKKRLKEKDRTKLEKLLAIVGTPEGRADLQARILEFKRRFPESDGWFPLVFEKLDKDGNPVYETQAYTFSNASSGKSLVQGSAAYIERVQAVSMRVRDEVEELHRRAANGDEAAQKILSQASWYREIRTRLRRTFGGLGDLFADLLGAASPNTPVRDNWDNAVDALRQATRGDFDALMPQWIAWADKVEAAEKEFRAWFDAERQKIGPNGKPLSKKAIKDSAGWKERAAVLSELRVLGDDLLPRKTGSDKKYGFNGGNIVRAMVDLWRVVKDADADVKIGDTAPKAINFSGNLIGFREGATIDVWAARMLQRLTGFLRVPPAAEGGVSGAMRATGETTLQFGFGQDVFAGAVKLIRADPTLGKDALLGSLNPDDLQAIVWFMEKEVWAKNSWTNAAGEGGSFEFEMDLSGVSQRDRIKELRRIADSQVEVTQEEKDAARQRITELQTQRAEAATPEEKKQIDKQIAKERRTIAKPLPEERAQARQDALAELDRMARDPDYFTGGVTTQTSQDFQGVEFVPANGNMARTLERIHTAALEGDSNASVIALKVASSKGYYGDPERSVDLEVVARDGYDLSRLWEEIRRIGAETNQDSVFLARTLRSDETFDPLKHRVSISVYFREGETMAKIKPLLKQIESMGMGMYTVIVDGRRTPSSVAGAMPKVVGVRFFALPEMDARFGDTGWEGLSDAEIVAKQKDTENQLDEVAGRINREIPLVSSAFTAYHEVNVSFRHEQIRNNADTGHREKARAPSGTPWQGRSLREAVAAAAVRDEAGSGTQGEGGTLAEPGAVPRGSAESVGRAAGETHSIARADSPLIAEIDALVQAPEAKAAIFQRMRELVAAVRARFEIRRLQARLGEILEDDPNARRDMLRDIATLEAIAKSLPPWIRGKLVGSFLAISGLKTSASREAYMLRLLPKIERAIEGHLVTQFRTAVRREFDRADIKVSEARVRGGKIGPVAHAIVEEARRAMKLLPEQAEATAEKLRVELETAPTMTAERLEELDGRIAALELFQDFENADSARLEEGLNLLKDVYRDGRRAWLEVLAARRDLRAGRIKTLRAGLNMDRPIDYAERPKAKRAGEKALRVLDEGFMEFMLSNSQKLRRLAELTSDPHVVEVVEQMEQDFLDAELAENDMNRADNEALAMAMRMIFGLSSEYAVAAKLRELTATNGRIDVTKIEGSKTETIKVPKNIVESILRGETNGWTDANGNRIELSPHDVAALDAAWEKFQEMEEVDQSRRRMLVIERRVSTGERKSVGELNQLEALQLYLTMNQPDQADKMNALGFDVETWMELDRFLKPETKALGMWMVEYLRQDQDVLDAMHRAEKGVALGLVENYFPIRNDVARADSGGLALDGQQQQQGGRSVGFIKERVTNFANPAVVNALAVFLAHRAQVNFWKSHVGALREWGGVIRDDGFATAVKTRMGENYYQSLARTLERIENGGSLNARGLMKMERAMKGLLKTFALGTLGMRMSTILVNATAAMNVFFEVPAKTLLLGALRVFKRPGAFKDAWNSPAIRRRLEEGATFEARLAKASGPTTKPVRAVLDSAADKGMYPINLVDTSTNVIGAAALWEHTRTESIRAGLSPEDARAAADAAVERLMLRAAQPTTRLARSEFEQRVLDSPLSAFFALFVSEPRKNFAITYMAVRQLLTGKGTYTTGMAAQQAFVGLVAYLAAERIVRSFYDAFVKASDEEEEGMFARWWDRLTDPKGWGYTLSSSHLSSVPVFGRGWDFIMAKAWDQPAFNKDPNPLLKLGTVPGNVNKLFEGTTEQQVEGATRIVQTLGTVVPGGSVFAQGANAVDFAEGLATSNGFSFSDEDRIRRLKARYLAAKRALDVELGPTKREDGTIDKDVQAAKWTALADKLAEITAPLGPELREAAIEAISPPREVVSRAGQ